MTEAIVWEDPNELPGSNAKGKRFVEELMKRPGEWAVSPLSRAGTFQLKRFRGVEITSRGQGKPGGKCYARYVGEAS